MVINENFPGLVKKGYQYIYKGDISSDEGLDITINLKIIGNVLANKDIHAFKNLEVIGGLFTKESLLIDGNLIVSLNTSATDIIIKGYLKCGSHIQATEVFSVGKYVESFGLLEARYIKVRGAIKVHSIYCTQIILCESYIKCLTDMVSYGDVQAKYIEAAHINCFDTITADYYIINKIKTKNYCIIHGLKYNIYILDKHIQIGCEFHSKKNWAKFTNDDIKQMDRGALKFWKKHKKLILGLT